MEAAFNQDQASGAQDQLGQACQNHMDRKGWQPNSARTKEAKKNTNIIGVGSVLAPIDSSAFVDSLQNGGCKSIIKCQNKFCEKP